MPARWTTSSKTGVGTALSRASRIWFTLSHGIVNEVYYPRVDQACTRDFGLIVTGPRGFFSEEKRQQRHEVSLVAPGVPSYRLETTCDEGRYRIEKEVLSDPVREVVLQRVRFIALRGDRSDYRLYAIAAPHLGNRGNDNTAWVGDFKGHEMLLASRDGDALAVACSAPWIERTVGFVGASDGWQDLRRHGRLTWLYDHADCGNVALTGEVDLLESEGRFVLALGLGQTHTEAAHRALASLNDGFDAASAEYVRAWLEWQNGLLSLGPVEPAERDIYRTSVSVLRVHESKRFPGGIIASLSIPWGSSKGDDDLGGYHLVWPRDLVESAGGLLAAGAREDAVAVIRYLAVTQDRDGHFPQNMWLDGTPYWTGVQMDETALPILLVDLARREGLLDRPALARFFPMIRRAAGYLVQNGPVTQQDRWERDPGYSPFTLAAEVAALLAAADIADDLGDARTASYLRETADAWNASIERWTYVVGTDLARELGIAGYYVRIASPDVADAASPAGGFVPIKSRPPRPGDEWPTHMVSPDALALVRFGLRAADDPRIVSTVKAIDALLRVETPTGPVWRRYEGDTYGEHADGRPFDGSGIGRAWPLLTGERAHYELSAGRPAEAMSLARTLESFANEGGLLPEQIWDAPDIPSRELRFGRASGSAAPLAWAHAEHVKLLRSLREGRVFDMPPQPVIRYQIEGVGSSHVIWRYNHRTSEVPVHRTLRIEVLEPALVHWTVDDWQTSADDPTQNTGLGVHLVDLPASVGRAGGHLRFTFYWLLQARWEGVDFEVQVIAEDAERTSVAG